MKCAGKKRFFASRCRWAIAVAGGMFAVIMMTAPAQAQTFRVIHNFTGFGDGSVPEAGVTIDRGGNLYSTTFQGTVFKMSHAGSGWILTTLYTFQGGSDGSKPASRVRCRSLS